MLAFASFPDAHLLPTDTPSYHDDARSLRCCVRPSLLYPNDDHSYDDDDVCVFLRRNMFFCFTCLMCVLMCVEVNVCI
jgi:hypothetical protein